MVGLSVIIWNLEDYLSMGELEDFLSTILAWKTWKISMHGMAVSKYVAALLLCHGLHNRRGGGTVGYVPSNI